MLLNKDIMKYLMLFASTTTLFCCALPALFVFLGFGATVASLVTSVPFLVTLSEYKLITFLVSGGLIFSSWYLLNAKTSCPADERSLTCSNLKRKSFGITIVSSFLWIVSVLISYVAPIFL